MRRAAKSTYTTPYNLDTTRKRTQVPGILFINLSSVYQTYFDISITKQGKLKKLSDKNGKQLSHFNLEESFNLTCYTQPIEYKLKGLICIQDVDHYILMYKDPRYKDELTSGWIRYDGLAFKSGGKNNDMIQITDLPSLNLKGLIVMNQTPIIAIYNDTSL